MCVCMLAAHATFSSRHIKDKSHTIIPQPCTQCSATFNLCVFIVLYIYLQMIIHYHMYLYMIFMPAALDTWLCCVQSVYVHCTMHICRYTLSHVFIHDLHTCSSGSMALLRSISVCSLCLWSITCPLPVHHIHLLELIMRTNVNTCKRKYAVHYMRLARESCVRPNSVHVCTCKQAHIHAHRIHEMREHTQIRTHTHIASTHTSASAGWGM